MVAVTNGGGIAAGDGPPHWPIATNLAVLAEPPFGRRADVFCWPQVLQLVTHLYGPAVRCEPNVNKWRGLVLRICIRPLHRAFVLLAIMDIRAHPISFSERP
jgi:hypothetical protein